MKKLFLTLAFIFLFIGCEKIEIRVDKLNGIYTSDIFQLADLDSVNINLVIDEGIITEMYLIPIEFKDKYLFKVNPIYYNTIIFTFEKESILYYGILEVNKNNYELIGHLYIKRVRSSYEWIYEELIMKKEGHIIY